MPRDPCHEIWIGLKFGDQINIRYRSVLTPFHQRTQTGFILFDDYRDVRCDDHEFSFSLTALEFLYQPVVAFLIDRAKPGAAFTGIVVPLGIVKHNDLYRNI